MNRIPMVATLIVCLVLVFSMASTAAAEGVIPIPSFIGDYPADREMCWTEEVNGIAHDDNNWFFATTDDPRLLKIPVWYPISECDLGDDCSTPPSGVLVNTGVPDALLSLNPDYDHYGDLDQAQGFLFVPVEGGSPHAIAVFRASDLSYVGANFVAQGQSSAGWVAYNEQDHLLYMSNSFIDSTPGNWLYRYTVNFDLLEGGLLMDADGQPAICPYDRIELVNVDGSPLNPPLGFYDDEGDAVAYMQGGVFTPWGDLYLVNGDSHNDADYQHGGVHLFTPDGSSRFKRVADSENGSGFFNYQWDPHPLGGEEPEGIDWWNRSIGPVSPGITGQLHVILLNVDLFTDNLYIKHYNVNTPPVADAGPDQIVNEGDLVTLDGTFTDPDVGDTHTFVWHLEDCNNGQVVPDQHTQSMTYIPCDNGVYTFSFTVTDSYGSQGSDEVTITANNVAPTADAGADETVDEGDTVSFSGSFADPGTCDTHTIEWDFGEGSTASGSLSPTHIYGDDGVFTVTLTVTDDDGGLDVDDLTVTVKNVAPSILAQSMEQPNDEFILPIVHTLDFETEVTDPGSDDLTFVWDWGDGAHDTHVYYNDGIGPDPYPSPEVRPMDVTDTVSHVYMSPGDYTVTLTVTDDDGGVDMATQAVHVCDVDEALIITNDYIQGLDDSHFKGPAHNRKAAIDNKFDALAHKWATKAYNGMIKDMRNDIREKADGYVDGKANDDWIRDATAQAEICQKIDDITAYLDYLLSVIP